MTQNEKLLHSVGELFVVHTKMINMLYRDFGEQIAPLIETFDFGTAVIFNACEVILLTGEIPEDSKKSLQLLFEGVRMTSSNATLKFSGTVEELLGLRFMDIERYNILKQVYGHDFSELGMWTAFVNLSKNCEAYTLFQDFLNNYIETMCALKFDDTKFLKSSQYILKFAENFTK